MNTIEGKLCEYLSGLLTDERLAALEKVIADRTRYITVVLEDIYQSQNASAVIRTCECFGLQDLHVIENRHFYRMNPDVALGSWQWVDLYKYKNEENNTLEAIKALKSKGYRIVATTPHTNDINIDDFDLEKGKAAFVFGTESSGITKTVYEHADEFVKIPMVGFTESLNISVTAAITVHHLKNKLLKSNIIWQLTPEEQLEIKLKWLKRTIRKVDLVINRFLSENNLNIDEYRYLYNKY